MDKYTSARNKLIIAALIIAISASFTMSNCSREKKNTESFNVALGEDDKSNVSQAAQTILNSNESETFEEQTPYASNGVIEIRDRLFISQVNDVYLNSRDYLGKTIKLEGVFKQEQFYFMREKPYYFVVRYGPSCCGDDGNVGFEVAWANDSEKSYPDSNSWVEAIGVLKLYQEGLDRFLYLDLFSLTVLNRRGNEFVFQ